MYKEFGLALVCVFVFNSAIAKKEIPVEHFNHLPMIQLPRISPDGESIAVIYNQGVDTQVAIVPFDNPTGFNILIKLGFEKYRIHDVNWVNNQKLIVTVSQPFQVNGNSARMPHLYVVDVNGEHKELKSTAYREADSDRKKISSSTVLLSLLDEDPDHILVRSRDVRDGGYSSVFKVNINSGKYSKYLPNTKKIFSWGPNKEGHILLAVGGTGNENNEVYIYVREDENASWEKIKTVEEYKTESFQPLFYDNKNHVLYVQSDYKLGKEAIWTFDTKKKEYMKVIGQAPGKLDVTSVITLHKNKQLELVGYRYYDDVEHTVYFDQNNNSINRQIKDLFAKQDLNANVIDYDTEKTKYIVSVSSDNKPLRYMLFDAKAMKFTPWFSQYPNLAKQELAEVESITFKARDGMELHGYYTVAKGLKNAPLILFPHGGPYARDYQSFDPFVQLFASRGYAVLQVNYRGSTGYGVDYELAGYQQWGRKMQTDLLDGVNWVKENRNADTDNACIVGASYGGYAALVAGFQTPKMFKCIASIAGVADLEQQISHWRVRGADEYINHAMNNNGKDVKDITPLHHVDKFQAPVLLIHGKADTSVDSVQSETMHKALKKAGKDSKFVTFKFGTHNLNDAANRKVAMEELDKFLKKHLD